MEEEGAIRLQLQVQAVLEVEQMEELTMELPTPEVAAAVATQIPMVAVVALA